MSKKGRESFISVRNDTYTRTHAKRAHMALTEKFNDRCRTGWNRAGQCRAGQCGTLQYSAVQCSVV